MITLGHIYDAENRLILVRNVDPLAAACDVDLAFTTYGDATRFAQSVPENGLYRPSKASTGTGDHYTRVTST